MTDTELMSKIKQLQAVQKTHKPTTSAWKVASELLAPLFKEAAKRWPGKK